MEFVDRCQGTREVEGFQQSYLGLEQLVQALLSRTHNSGGNHRLTTSNTKYYIQSVLWSLYIALLPIIEMQLPIYVVRNVRAGFCIRSFATKPAFRSRWTSGPSPPRLPKEEQEIFEKLQQQSTGAFSTPHTTHHTIDHTKPESEVAQVAYTSSSEADAMLEQLRERARLVAKGDGEELHPNVRRGAPPEFEGDVNPKTGEVGGPKNEPLKWGVTGDWSYNGRVTDF